MRRSLSALLLFLAGAAAMELAHRAYPQVAGPSVAFMMPGVPGKGCSGQVTHTGGMLLTGEASNGTYSVKCGERFNPTDDVVAFCGCN